MSDQNKYSDSLYQDSQYPPRRQASGSSGSSGGQRRRSSRRKPRRNVGRTVWQVLGTLLLVGLCTGAILCCFAAVYINRVIVPLADLSLDDFTYGENSVMYYQDKTTGEYVEMTTLLSVTDSVWVDLEDMPEDLIDAAVAIEDKRFWTHSGVDWGRTARAVLSMFTGGDIQGGSTITQQLLKNLTEYDEVTVKRKVTEIVRALRFTQNNSKEDTIEMYLNIIPLGAGCEGVGAAAEKYFGKSVSDLTLAECASLVAITNNPSRYGPYSFARSETSTGEVWDSRQWNKYRQELILSEMLDQGKITQEEYDQAVAQELVFVGLNSDGTAGSVTEEDIYTWYEETVISDVRDALRTEFGWSDSRVDQALQNGGLRIYTCFDPKVQAAVDEIYTNRENLNYTASDGQLMQSAITVIDNSTGDVVAIAGQFGEKEGNLLSNYANDSKRQPGSSIKPLSVYSAAIDMGLISPITVLDDYPYQVMNGSAWPVNSGAASYRGKTTVANALMRSVNTIAVRIVADLITPEESFNFVQDRYHIDLEEGRDVNGQIKSDVTVASMALGGLTDGVTTRDMAEAYATFPNNGTYTYSRTFTRVTQVVDGEEVVLLENEQQQEQEHDGASCSGHQIVSGTAADAHHNGPENIDGVPGILDGRPKTDDGQSAHHTKGQGNVIANDDHHRGGDHCQGCQGNIEFCAVNAPAVRQPVRQEHKGRDGRRHHQAEHNDLRRQITAAGLQQLQQILSHTRFLLIFILFCSDLPQLWSPRDTRLARQYLLTESSGRSTESSRFLI